MRGVCGRRGVTLERVGALPAAHLLALLDSDVQGRAIAHAIPPCGDGFAARFVDLSQLTLLPISGGGPRLYDALDAAFDGFALLRAERDVAGRITDFVCVYVNQIGAKLSERSQEDVVGRRVTEL